MSASSIVSRVWSFCTTQRELGRRKSMLGQVFTKVQNKIDASPSHP